MNELSVMDKFVAMQQVNVPRNFIKANAKQAKEIYPNDHVVTLGEELEITTQSLTRKKQYISLYEAIRTESVMKGVITSCYIDNATNMVNVAIVQDHFKIIIPLPLLIRLPEKTIEIEKQKPANNQIKFLQMLGNMRIGSVVEFIPRQINEYEGFCIASRIMALDKLKRLYYFPRVEQPLPTIREGVVVQGKVCYVKKTAVCVEVGGVELEIREGDISYLRIANAQDLYQPGDYVPVKVNGIEFVKDEKGNILDINIKASIKEAMPNPQKENFNKYSIGENVRGVVSQRTDDGVFVKLENSPCDVKCAPQKNVNECDKANVGDKVLVRITAKDEKAYFINGVIKWNYTKNVY